MTDRAKPLSFKKTFDGVAHVVESDPADADSEVFEAMFEVRGILAAFDLPPVLNRDQ